MTAINPTPFNKPPLKREMSWPARIGWLFVAILCIGIAAYFSRYLLNPPTTPEEALGNPVGVPWLFIHVAGAVVALLVGSFQFLPGLRRGSSPPHRWTGRVYVAGCLVGGVAGLILASRSSAGPIATAGFGSPFSGSSSACWGGARRCIGGSPTTVAG